MGSGLLGLEQDLLEQIRISWDGFKPVGMGSDLLGLVQTCWAGVDAHHAEMDLPLIQVILIKESEQK